MERKVTVGLAETTQSVVFPELQPTADKKGERSSHTHGPLSLGFPFSFGQSTAIHLHVVFFIASRKTGKPKLLFFRSSAWLVSWEFEAII